MSDRQRLARLWSLLFPPEQAPVHPPRRLFAVLDGARDPSIHVRVKESGRPFACLYRGELPAPLVEVAPYLVELADADEWSRSLIADAWGESWGIFVDTRVDLPLLMRRLRGFLKVRDEGGRQLVFRYYDPRVFRSYLPTVTAAEGNAVTGPVRAVLHGKRRRLRAARLPTAWRRLQLRNVARFGRVKRWRRPPA